MGLLVIVLGFVATNTVYGQTVTPTNTPTPTGSVTPTVSPTPTAATSQTPTPTPTTTVPGGAPSTGLF